MAVSDAYVFPGFLIQVLTLLFFQSHRLLFSHASAEVRGESTPERKVASTWDRTHNHQVMSLTRSPLSHPGSTIVILVKVEVLIATLFLILPVGKTTCTYCCSKPKSTRQGYLDTLDNKPLTLYHTIPNLNNQRSLLKTSFDFFFIQIYFVVCKPGQKSKAKIYKGL